MTAVLRCWCNRHAGDVIYLRPEDYLAEHEPDQEVVPLPTKKAAPKQPPPRKRLEIVDRDGTLHVVYPWNQYRFLFEDGETIDVVAIADSSDLREAMLELAKSERIVGVATVLVGMSTP